jgi:transcriptional regulator with XRE-family HTH domain
MKAIQKLRQVLTMKKVSQQEAAEGIGISGAFLSQILSGKRTPLYGTMTKIKVWSGGLVDYEDWEVKPLARQEEEA